MAKTFNKNAILVKGSPIFVVNRILTSMINEATFVLAEGIVPAEDIDKGMKLGAQHPVRPLLSLADIIGTR